MIQLFKAGTSCVYNGITCEMQTVNEFGFEHYLEDGWHFTPEECYPKESKVPVLGPGTTTENMKKAKEETLEKVVDTALKETAEAEDALKKVKTRLSNKAKKMTTKAELINGAYSLLRISGITVDPSAEDNSLELERLEDMAEEFDGRNIQTDYNFEETPLVNSIHNLPRKFWFAYKSNLAVRLAPDFGKEAPPLLVSQQRAGFSFLSSFTAPLKETRYPNRMPMGARNSLRTQSWRRYYNESAEAPLGKGTITMFIDDIRDFMESWVAYLDSGETIASYTIEADTGLTINSDSNTTTAVTYNITATGLSTESSVDLLQVKIIITTSAGRVDTRLINFQLQDSTIRG